MQSSFRVTLGLVATLFLGLVPALSAGEPPAPTRELLRLVGQDVGMCVEVSGLAETVGQQSDSPLVERLRAVPVVRDWFDGPEWAKLQRHVRNVRQVVGRPVPDFARDLVGRSVVFAAYAVPDGEPEGVLLVRATGGAVVDELLDAWRRADPKVRRDERKHAGGTYHRAWHGNDDDPGFFYAVLGPVLVASEHENRIRDVLQAAGRTGENTGLLASPRYRTARRAVRDDALASVYVNPRAWDFAIDADDKDPMGRAMRQLWLRTESMVFAIDGRNGLVFESEFRQNPVKLSSEWRERLSQTYDESEFLARVPRRALLAAVGRFDIAMAIESAYAGIPEDERRRVEPLRRFLQRRVLGGVDVFALLQAFEADMGVYIVPRSRMVEGVPPIDVVVGVRLADEPTMDGERPSRDVLDDVLTSSMELWVALAGGSAEGKIPEVNSDEENGRVVRWIENVGPLRPGFALTPKFLLVSTDPELVAEFVSNDRRLVDDPTFARIRAAHFPDREQLLLLNVGAVRGLLEEHESFLVAESARREGAPIEDVRERLNRIREILGIVDVAYIAGSVTAERVRLSAGALVQPGSKGR